MSVDLSQLAKAIGKEVKSEDSLIRVGNTGTALNVPYYVLTGIPGLDYGAGGLAHPGFPGARIIELFGAEGSGKSTLALWLTHCSMKQLSCPAFYQDVEHVLTDETINGIGLDMSNILTSQPEMIETALNEQRAAITALAEQFHDTPIVTVMDSVAACSDENEMKGEIGDSHMAALARAMSQGMRMLKGKIADTQVLSIWTNQIRDTMNTGWGASTTTPGGRALRFYAAIRVQLSRVGWVKDSAGNTVGATIRAKFIKNKIAPPLKETDYNIMFHESSDGSFAQIDLVDAMIQWCIKQGFMTKTGAYITLKSPMFPEFADKKKYMSAWHQLFENDQDMFMRLRELCYSVGKESKVDTETGEVLE